jgi:hypothetical protein
MTLQVIQNPTNEFIQVKQDHAKTFHDYTEKKLAKESRRSYAFGWRKFETWLQEHGYVLKKDENHIVLLVGAFLSDMARTGSLKYKSLVSYHAAIRSYVRDFFHIELDYPEIKKAMRGIHNELRHAPIKKKAVKAEHISSMELISNT